MALQETAKSKIVYPESDGKPMADNTRQLEAIVYLFDNLSALFAEREDVFVAADLFWYPVEGHPEIRTAPDVMVVLGRPKGHRPSYKQWEEENIPPQVVFEVLSPSNRPSDLVEKYLFYQEHGVQEYYLYDPDRGILDGWVRKEGELKPVEQTNGWVSPLIGIRFTLEGEALVVYRPDGERFVSYAELRRRYEQAQREAEQERVRAEQAQREAEQERLRAEQAQREAEQERLRAEQAQREAERERLRAEQLAQRLRELGIDPNGVVE
ncbi:MAG: Uma2 family endonuclease [Armatimonadetes bacterium]|nr:Uma2 family endonuclease [Armatimonadota bacterium]